MGKGYRSSEQDYRLMCITYIERSTAVRVLHFCHSSDLLETNKPYLTNVMRVPALQTVMLFSPSLDTNSDCTRLVVDEWLELKFPSSETGQEVIAAVQTLRSMWTHLLELKLKASQCK